MTINDILKQLLLNVLHVKYKTETSESGSRYYKFNYRGANTTIRVSDHPSTRNHYPIDIVLPVLDKHLTRKERTTIETLLCTKYKGFKIRDIKT